MNAFALRNLVRNRARSLLALAGLALATAGVIVLVALSLGARKLARELADKAPGIFVMKAEALPHFSKVRLDLGAKIAQVPGVTAVDPEVWVLAYQIEHQGALLGAASMPTLVGVAPARHAALRDGGVYARHLLRGRMPRADETRGAVISEKIAKHYKKDLGATIHVLDDDFTVTGVFATRSPVFDGVIVAHEATVRGIAELSSSTVSCFFVEGAPGEDLEPLRRRVQAVLPRSVEAGTTADWSAGGEEFVSGLDALLGAIAAAAGSLGALGVVNTMLMSVRERVRELGVLRAVGWRRGDVFRLIVTESAVLGATGGLLGVGLGALGAAVAAALLPLTPALPTLLLAASVAGAILLGALGGLYPAIAAARVEPMVAIKDR